MADMPSVPRVFVSHSQRDNEITDRVVADLRAAGVDVWIDTAEIVHDDFQDRINAGLMDRDWLILIETPESLHSPWVRREVNAALQLKDQGRLRDVIPFVMKPCVPSDVPPLWAILHHYDATVDYPRALHGLLNAIGLKRVASDPFESHATPVTPVTPVTPGRADVKADTVPPQAYAPPNPIPSPVYPYPPPTVPANPVPSAYPPPAQRPRKPPMGWIVAGVLSGILIVVLCSMLIIVAASGNTSGNSTGIVPTDTPVPAATETPAVTTIFNGTLTTQLAGWPSNQDCFFGSDGYHVVGAHYCAVPTNPLSDLGVEVTVAQVSGQTSDYFGIAIRLNNPSSYEAGYRFLIDGAGDWTIDKCLGDGSCSRLSSGAASSAINTGLNTSNMLDVTALGSQLDFQVNSHTVGQADDSTYASGVVGLECGGSSEVVFTNLTILT
jgi:hypothetical protein